MIPQASEKVIGVLTSGGDAPGMNAALRAVVRVAISMGARVYAIYEGYQGMVDGGDRIRELNSSDVGGIMQRGGTMIGTARCAAFRTRDGRRQAARNLIERGIDRLVVIGGDGSLTGANLFRQEWSSLLAEMVRLGEIEQDIADLHPYLAIVGLVGSIDNDFSGTDMTIGADTALHRITDALDQIGSTASSHQRTFVVEVMGRNCGYLALMSSLAGTAHWVFIPESPPETDDWETLMCDVLAAGRAAGRRHSMVVIAEGARDRNGNPITSAMVCKALEERLGEDARVTILGHIQRGGAPSAFDRWMSTLVGQAAVEELLNSSPESEPQLIGMRYNRITHLPLMECVTKTRAVAEAISNRDYERAMDLRGGSFKDQFRILRTLLRALPHPPPANARRLRLAILTDGAPAPGMNTAVRAAVRMAVDEGHSVMAVKNGFEGLIRGDFQEFGWMDVHGWGSMGGSQLGVSRKVPSGREWYAIARTLEEQGIEGLLIIGGWSAYEAAQKLYAQRDTFPAFNIPIICLPASIDNNLPGSELSIGADTALNSIVEVLDKLKQSAVATRRCFVVEVMGGYCGYLALMSGLASGAERVYLNEEGVTLKDLEIDLNQMIEEFKQGKRLSLLIRNEQANPLYTTGFMSALFEEESHGLFDVREAILGHMQQGGNPSPFDRVQATRLATRCVEFLTAEAEKHSTNGAYIGIQAGQIKIHNLEDIERMVDIPHTRQKEQWWLDLRPLVKQLS
ncbi:MAG TPA: 6-phosphofructokinase [Anaerolineaceae bacterium]